MNRPTPLPLVILFTLALAVILPCLFIPPAEAVTPPVELVDAPEIAVDWNRGRIQSVRLGGNRSLTFGHGEKGARYLLIVTQDTTGSRTVSWPSSVRWPGTYPLTLTTTAGKTDYITFFYNGVSYDAVGSAQNL